MTGLHMACAPTRGTRHDAPWVKIARMAVGEFDLIAKYFARPVRRAVLGGGDD